MSKGELTMNASIQQHAGVKLSANTRTDTFQKMGGAAALIEAATFLVGMALGFTLLAPYMTGALDTTQTIAFLADNQTIVYAWNQVIYIVFGIFLAPLALALHARLQANSPGMMQTATAFGLIWAGLVLASGMIFNVGLASVIELAGSDMAQATAMWQSVHAVHIGLGGGNEIVGGMWVLLISWAALRGGGLSKALNFFGLLVSLAGVITIVPGLGDVGAIFGLGSIVWFAWVGIVLLRGHSNAAA
jgi:hypothetical protein